MRFAKLPVANIRESIENALMKAILLGDIEAGTVLTSPSLAEEFGVSRTPVREAMLNLERLGFVRILRNKGFLVIELSEKDLRDAIQLRSWIESPAMRIVAEKATPAQLAACREVANCVSEAADKADRYEYYKQNGRLHTALLEIVGNKQLVTIATELRIRARRIGLALMCRSDLQKAAKEHHLLIDLLEARQGAGAEALMAEHLLRQLAWLPDQTQSQSDEDK